jgi:hypothetical protein
MVSFVSGLFTVKNPTPEEFWAESVLYDNSDVIEKNFGRLVGLLKDDLTSSKTKAPYLSAVRGLFFAYTNGPTIRNVRLGLQILLGLPFTEERGIIRELQENFTKDAKGRNLGRLLIEDLDDSDRLTGNRRVYFYPTAVGLETNSVTALPYKAGDFIDKFTPISKGVEVKDYIKDPYWWENALYGMEILKYFTFKILVDSNVFDSNDVQFALNFVKSIKPTYTKVIASLLLALSDDITVEDAVGGAAVLKFYDNVWGLEATNRATDDNNEGAILWNLGSRPLHTRTLKTLWDLISSNSSGVVVNSTVGWLPANVRGRTVPGSGLPILEGDLLYIHAGHPGSGVGTPAIYEIDTVVSATQLRLKSAAPFAEQDSLNYAALNPALFQYGTGISGCIVRRQASPLLLVTDLSVTANGQATSALAKFLTNGVMPGDTLIIESGVNQGEYTVDAVENTGSGASIAWAVGATTVTGLANMTLPSPGIPGSAGGRLEILNGAHPGTYRILSYISPTSVTIYNPSYTGSESGRSWREQPRGAFISESLVQLKLADGSLAVLTPASGLTARAVCPFLQRGLIYGASSRYNAGLSRMELWAQDWGLSRDRDVFTPGMVGVYVSVSDSQNPVNDGVFFITDYVSPGKVVIDSTSVTSDSSNISTLKFVGI